MMLCLSRTTSPRRWAQEIMEKFRFSAYDLGYMRTFQTAVDTLYGHVYVIKLSHSGRMQFHCKVCQKQMSNEKCVLEHSLSAAHQKKLNIVPAAGTEGIFQVQTYIYLQDTLQYKLLHNVIPVVGLQMVEEYRRSPRDEPYYRCNLCVAHGKIQGIFNHIIGKKHTEKYIKNRCVLTTSVISPVMLEVHRRQLVDIEGLKCDLIKTIIGNAYYPHKLIEAAKAKLRMKAWKAGKMDIKTEDRYSWLPSPVPGTSNLCRVNYETSESSFRSNLQPIMKLESSSLHEEEEGRASSSFPDQSPPKKRMFLDGTNVSCDKKLHPYKMENIVEGLKFIMKTNSERSKYSVLRSNHEAREAIDLMSAIATVLRQNAVSEKPSPQREKKLVVFEQILGELVFSLKKVLL